MHEGVAPTSSIVSAVAVATAGRVALGRPSHRRDALRVSWFVVAALVVYPYVAILVASAYVKRTTPTESWFDEQLRRFIGNGGAYPT
jgi:hypothetical protein